MCTVLKISFGTSECSLVFKSVPTKLILSSLLIFVVDAQIRFH